MIDKRTGALLGAATLGLSTVGLMEDTTRRMAQARVDRTIFEMRHVWRRRFNNMGVVALVVVGAGFVLYAVKTHETVVDEGAGASPAETITA